MSSVSGCIEVSYFPEYLQKNKIDKSSIQHIIEQSGATVTQIYIPTDKNRFTDLVYELRVAQESSLDDIREKILNDLNLKGVVKNVSTVVDE
jgi:hypothetical protein